MHMEVLSLCVPPVIAYLILQYANGFCNRLVCDLPDANGISVVLSPTTFVTGSKSNPFHGIVWNDKFNVVSMFVSLRFEGVRKQNLKLFSIDNTSFLSHAQVDSADSSPTPCFITNTKTNEEWRYPGVCEMVVLANGCCVSNTHTRVSRCFPPEPFPTSPLDHDTRLFIHHRKQLPQPRATSIFMRNYTKQTVEELHQTGEIVSHWNTNITHCVSRLCANHVVGRDSGGNLLHCENKKWIPFMMPINPVDLICWHEDETGDALLFLTRYSVVIGTQEYLAPTNFPPFSECMRLVDWTVFILCRNHSAVLFADFKFQILADGLEFLNQLSEFRFTFWRPHIESAVLVYE
jgi:hypothetical protein